MSKPFQCSNCRKSFNDANALYSHAKAKHGKSAQFRQLHRDRIAARRAAEDDDDESFADRAIQAQLDHASGIHNPDYDWLVEPFL